MAVVETPVLILGGGGLSVSAFLSNLGVGHLLVERHDTISHLPEDRQQATGAESSCRPGRRRASP